jgi:hypothetical protein
MSHLSQTLAIDVIEAFRWYLNYLPPQLLHMQKEAKDISTYNDQLSGDESSLAHALATIINHYLPHAESKIWHGHPVWFIDGNPLVGYSKLKGGVRLLFWSGQSFDEPLLVPEGKFKAAEYRFAPGEGIDALPLERWLKKAVDIQWDYKNIANIARGYVKNAVFVLI